MEQYFRYYISRGKIYALWKIKIKHSSALSSCMVSYRGNKFPMLIKRAYHAFKLGLSLSIMLVAKVTAWWTHYKVSAVQYSLRTLLEIDASRPKYAKETS